MNREMVKSIILFFVVLILGDLVGGVIYHRIDEKRLEKYRLIVDKEKKILRSGDLPYGYGFLPNVHVPSQWMKDVYEIFTNSLAFRDSHNREVPLTTKDYRMIFIGDSFTEGIGFDYERTFVGILDRKLSSQNMEVLNAAVVSYSPLIYWKKVDYLINDLGLKFDELVVFLDLSDIAGDKVRGGISREGPVTRMDRQLFSLKETLKTYSLFTNIFVVIKRNVFPYGIHNYHSLWTIRDSFYQDYAIEGLKNATRNMNELFKLLESKGIHLTLVVYPYPDQIFYHDLDSKQVVHWKEWARQKNVRFINLFPYFVNEEPWRKVLNKYYIPSDVHWSEKGHQLVAEAFWKERTKLAPL